MGPVQGRYSPLLPQPKYEEVLVHTAEQVAAQQMARSIEHLLAFRSPSGDQGADPVFELLIVDHRVLHALHQCTMERLEENSRSRSRRGRGGST